MTTTKRSRNVNTSPSTSNANGEDSKLIQKSGASIMDVDESNLMEILLRLPVKAIIMCKCVCKPWQKLISSLWFAEQHFARAQPSFLAQTFDITLSPRTIFLIEPSKVEDIIAHERFEDNNRDIKNLELDTKLEISLPSSRENRRFELINSCNGILCHMEQDGALAVCNPITGEFVNIPSSELMSRDSSVKVSFCGFGCSPSTNEYKVLRTIMIFKILLNEDVIISTVAEIHTLGSGSWRRIPCPVTHKDEIRGSPIYLNGTLNWSSYRLRRYIHSFDLDLERFGSILLPPLRETSKLSQLKLGVVYDCLCLCDIFLDDKSIDIWMLLKYGDQTSWTKYRTIRYDIDELWPYYLYDLNFVHNKESCVILHGPAKAIVSHTPRRNEFKYFLIQNIHSWLAAITHVPSFISLSDTLAGAAVEIVNIGSRSADLKSKAARKSICRKQIGQQPNEDKPLRIVDRQVLKELRTRKVLLFKVIWETHNNLEKGTWKLEDHMRKQHPELFSERGKNIGAKFLYR